MLHHTFTNIDGLDEDINPGPLLRFSPLKPLKPWHKFQHYYCWFFYGLMTHKLAHFFDVVHGTRHNYFMSEYRTQFILEWVNLLERRGFDPEEVERLSYAHDHLWKFVV